MNLTVNKNPSTVCNPVNISYQYQEGFHSRESADPSAIMFKDEYYLFASHGSGYWWSSDLVDWNFVYCAMPEINNYAPAVCVIGDYIYLTHSGGAIYRSGNPKSGVWEFVSRPYYWGDPTWLADDDGRVYCYYCGSPPEPISVVELDPNNNMALLAGPFACFYENRTEHGFEVIGDNNDQYDEDCWMEGPWMTKYNGRYYLQYAAPATQFTSYADGCYTSDSPIGPFVYENNSPVSYKATGFLTGMGHGSLIQDRNGNWWKFSTVAVSVNHVFERRLIMTPAKFDEYGQLITNAVFADYPMYKAYHNNYNFYKPNPPWHLISLNAAAAASSSLQGFAPSKAFDENIRTWWSARTGNTGEWLAADLGRAFSVNAAQINFADQDALDVYGRDNEYVYRYLLEVSRDGINWDALADTSDAAGEPFKAADNSHIYYELEEAASVRFIRITNKGSIPAGGKFAVSGLRLFGHGGGDPPQAVENFTVRRNASDERSVTLFWDKAGGAEGYIIRFGNYKNALNTHYQAKGDNTATINCLNKCVDYYFTIDSYNENGVTYGKEIKYTPARRTSGRG